MLEQQAPAQHQLFLQLAYSRVRRIETKSLLQIVNSWLLCVLLNIVFLAQNVQYLSFEQMMEVILMDGQEGGPRTRKNGFQYVFAPGSRTLTVLV